MDDFKTKVYYVLYVMADAMEGMSWTLADAQKLVDLVNDLGNTVLRERLLDTEVPLDMAFEHAIEELAAIGYIELKSYEETKKLAAESRTALSFDGNFASDDQFIFIKQPLYDLPKCVSEEQDEVTQWATAACLVGDPRCYRQPEDFVDMAAWAIDLHERQRRKAERKKLERKKKTAAKTKTDSTKSRTTPVAPSRVEPIKDK